MQTNLRADGRDDLLPRKCAAAALDHRAVFGHFIGAVDVDRHVGDVVQLLDEDAMALEPLGRLHRARDGTFDPMLDFRELVDEEIRRRAGADADDLVIYDVFDRLAGDGLLQFVLGHRTLAELECVSYQRGRSPAEIG